MSALFALLAAGSFGVGDFLGGIATRRVGGNPTPVIAIGHLAGLALAVVLVLVFPGDVWSSDLAVGAAAGLVGAIGLAFLYRGLGRGRMGTAAPIAAVLAAVIPVAWGLATGELPTATAAMGVVLGLIAIPLVASSPDASHVGDAPGRASAGAIDGLLAGVGFGVFFILLDLAGDGSGAVPLLGARLATAPLFVALSFATGGGLATASAVRRPAVWSGILDMAANGWFLAAVRIGQITEIAVLTALAPAVTVAMARSIENERLSRVQLAGVPVAIAGIALIAAGS